MPKILSNEIIEQVLTMPACIDVMEEAYVAWANDQAITRTRSDTYMPVGNSTYYVLKTMDGILGTRGIGSIRLNSDLIQWSVKDGVTKKTKLRSAQGGRYNGMVLLFDTHTGEIKAMFPDGFIQKLRVAATGALSVKYMARKDADVLGLIGTGWQATGAIEAVNTVRPLKQVKVYSTNPKHRQEFADTYLKKLGIPVLAVDSAREAVRGASIVSTATNSLNRVIEGDWLEPGCHVYCVKYSELGDGVRSKADWLAVNVHYATPENHIPGIGRVSATDPIDLLEQGFEKEALSEPEDEWAKTFPELHEIVNGSVVGRHNDDEITLFVNNNGIGLQFSAAGAAALQLAEEQNLGIDIPIDWFVQTVHP
ncbi:MAG: ornithine cyclodeaminase family protein [Acidimicrobiaceae bacterium]|nr:ornithine cyclodeaminase family protein [Acidimicrobiaceae bacterium]